MRNFLDVWDVLQGHAELGSDVLLDRSLWRAPPPELLVTVGDLAVHDEAVVGHGDDA